MRACLEGGCVACQAEPAAAQHAPAKKKHLRTRTRRIERAEPNQSISTHEERGIKSTVPATMCGWQQTRRAGPYYRGQSWAPQRQLGRYQSVFEAG